MVPATSGLTSTRGVGLRGPCRNSQSAVRSAVRARCAFCRHADEQYTASDRALKPAPHISQDRDSTTAVTLQLFRERCALKRALEFDQPKNAEASS